MVSKIWYCVDRVVSVFSVCSGMWVMLNSMMWWVSGVFGCLLLVSVVRNWWCSLGWVGLFCWLSSLCYRVGC